MQLRVARLCLDCEELHDAQQCPVCASDSFAYITRWVPAPEGRLRLRPKPPSSEELTAYATLAGADAPPSKKGRLLKRSVIGLSVIGLVGWIWKRSRKEADATSSPPTTRTERVPHLSAKDEQREAR